MGQWTFDVLKQGWGVQSPKEGENGIQFDADGTVSEETIYAHPQIDYLVPHFDGQFDSDNKIVIPPTLTIEGEEIKNPFFGVKKFWDAGLTWTKTYVTLNPRDSLCERLGKIDIPPRAPGGYFPHLSGRRNWLKIVAKPSWRGNIWKVTESWICSGDGGWVEDVYR